MGIYQREHQLPVLSEEDAAAWLVIPANLEQVQQWLAAKPASPGPEPDPVATALAALTRLQAIPSLSQSLGGFNDALLTRRHTLQLDVADPLGFDDYRAFTAAVRPYVQGPAPGQPTTPDGGPLPPYLSGRNRTAPQPLGTFQPIRSGAFRVVRLRLLDAFGRVLDLHWDRVTASRLLPAAGGDLITLPPRFVQPARLNFRWLSADLGDQQLTELAAHSPVCGWMLPNHFAESLAFYQADGTALGSIDRTGTWQVAPGAAPVFPDQVTDPHLKAVISYLIGKGSPFLQNFHGAVDSALENIDPPNLTRQPDTAVLVSRPLAVVRASVDLQLQGLPAADQTWTALRHDLRSDTRQTAGFTGVRVPVRIGDYRQLSDGLVGYWVETPGGFDDVFNAPLSDPVDDPGIRTHAGGEIVILQAPDAPAQTLTMLVDPRGNLHATCGVLPVKTISIPAEQYADALGRIEVTFPTGPILSSPRDVEVPLPAGQEDAWSWVEATPAGWRRTWTQPVVDRQAFLDGLARALWDRLTDRTVQWLRPVSEDPPAAAVVAVHDRVATSLAPWPAGIAAALDEILGSAGGRPLTLAGFSARADLAIGGPAWGGLLDPAAGWLSPGGRDDVARITIGEAAATPSLPDPLAGLDAVLRSVLDLTQRRILPPGAWPGTALRRGSAAPRGMARTTQTGGLDVMTMPPVVLSVQASGPDPLASYPVAFTLRDDDGEGVITISDDPAEQHGHLEISNTSGGPLLLGAPPAGATAAAGQYHFELRFRPGVLSATSLAQLRVDELANWSASSPEQQPDGTVSLYLLSTTGLTFDPAAPLRFRLSALGADGANGARGTQLELRFKLRFADGTPLADTKLLHVDLVNQRGLRNIPLHVGFVGSHTVLNDDRTPNTLDVRITNASASDLRLGGRDSSRPSRLVISFDVSTADEDLGLASPSELAAMTLEAIDGHVPDGSDWVVEPGRQLGEGLAWTLTHTGTDPVLEAGQVVRIRIANIITGSASGDTNLYLRYEDIPGYWDGQFVCTLEKGPILFDARGNVGIETAAPRYRLQVGEGPGALGIDAEGTPVDATYLRFGDNSGRALRVARSQESPGDGPVNSGPAWHLDDGPGRRPGRHRSRCPECPADRPGRLGRHRRRAADRRPRPHRRPQRARPGLPHRARLRLDPGCHPGLERPVAAAQPGRRQGGDRDEPRAGRRARGQRRHPQPDVAGRPADRERFRAAADDQHPVRDRRGHPAAVRLGIGLPARPGDAGRAGPGGRPAHGNRVVHGGPGQHQGSADRQHDRDRDPGRRRPSDHGRGPLRRSRDAHRLQRPVHGERAGTALLTSGAHHGHMRAYLLVPGRF